MTRVAARLVILTLMAVPAIAAARQTFLPNPPPQQQANFKTAVMPSLSITTEPGDLPVKLHHISGTGKDELDVRARSITVTYTKTGLSVELVGGTAGTYTVTKSPIQTRPSPFETLQLEFATNGELLWQKAK